MPEKTHRISSRYFLQSPTGRMEHPECPYCRTMHPKTLKLELSACGTCHKTSIPIWRTAKQEKL